MQFFKKSLIFIVVNIIAIFIFNFIFAEPSVYKMIIKNASEDASINSVIMGHSHAESGINPFVLSDEMNWDVYNCARNGAYFPDIPYFAREINKNHNIKRIILEMDPEYWMSFDDEPNGWLRQENNEKNALYILSGKNLFDFFIREGVKESFSYTFFNYSLGVSRLKKIKDVIKIKSSSDFRNNNPDFIPQVVNVLQNGTKYYEFLGKGFKYGIAVKENVNKNYSYSTFDKTRALPKVINAFDNLLEYCKKEDIELICVTSVIHPYRLLKENFNEMHDFFTDFCEKRNVAYYDMNYVKNEILPRKLDEYVDYDGHLMLELANKQTSCLAEILKSENPEDFFETNYDNVRASLYDVQ